MKGYKAFDKDLTCRGFQYEIGKTYEMDEKPKACSRGFHFCQTVADCYKYYEMSENTRICEVEALGDLDTDDEIKYATNKIAILSEILDEQMRRGNTEKNEGYWNTGNWNTGNCNTGDWNTGNWNTGNCNTGDWNTGNWNTGNCNTGNCNTGDWNTGNWNTGNCNTGNCNTGYRNTGNRNTGNWNTGNWNTGYRNTGNRNTGNWNTGNWNTGCFCTDKYPKIKLFDKESDWTMNDWRNSSAWYVLRECPCTHTEFIWKSDMTTEEKEKHPECETISGYLKTVVVTKEDKQKWWDGLSDMKKGIIKDIPNFDADKFVECIGIDHI